MAAIYLQDVCVLFWPIKPWDQSYKHTLTDPVVLFLLRVGIHEVCGVWCGHLEGEAFLCLLLRRLDRHTRRQVDHPMGRQALILQEGDQWQWHVSCKSDSDVCSYAMSDQHLPAIIYYANVPHQDGNPSIP